MSLTVGILQWLGCEKASLLNHPFSLSLLFLPSLLILLWLNGILARSKFKFPPSPPRLPLIGHLHCLGTLPHRSLQTLSHKYGPLMLLRFGSTPTLVVSSADMGREIMKTHDAVFSSRPVTTAVKEFVYGGKDVVFAPSGEYWRQMRKICVTDLLSVKRVQSFQYVRDEEVTIMVSKIKESCISKKDVNLRDLTAAVTNNIISRVTAGGSLEKKNGAKLMKEVVDHFGGFSVEDLFPSLGWVDVLTGLTGRMRKTSKAANLLLDEVIEEHLMAREKDANAKNDRKDLVDLLLEWENNTTLGIEFTRENIRSVILDMFAAGTETTYGTVEWAMAALFNHPNVMNKVQEEIRLVVGTKSKVDEEDLSQMEYLKCVIKETLRLYPSLVLSIPRVSTASADVDGYHIPAKTNVIINLWAISRDPKVWDRPDEFIPERFMNNSVDFKGNHFEFIPFGAGRRGCPGLSFGTIAVESILANLLYWFDWELARSSNKGYIDMTEVFGLSMRLKYPLHLAPISHFP
ncbi:hypothetical protein ACHQM5_010989 [Ranunculus cassubicifolius]